MTRLEVIRAATVLPARRGPVHLKTADGLSLIGELALPENQRIAGALVMLHPLPTHGGMMDSHIYRKAAYRLPSLADLAIFRFNTRGTESEQGKSEGQFSNGIDERLDVEAAIDFVATELPQVQNIWVVGWSFGTDLALKHARDPRVQGLILLSPPLRTSEESDLEWWAKDGRRVIAIIPEFDDYLPPAQARQRFAKLTQLEIIEVANGKHLWIGEPSVQRIHNEIVKIVNPARYPLPTEIEIPD
jgi:alpha/beta superfamily hydrolase